MTAPYEICPEDYLMSMVWKRTPAGDMAFNRCPLNATGTVLLWNLDDKKGEKYFALCPRQIIARPCKYAYMWIYLYKPHIFTYAYLFMHMHENMHVYIWYLLQLTYMHGSVVYVHLSVYIHMYIMSIITTKKKLTRNQFDWIYQAEWWKWGRT